ncbi:unnamed protein product, partial [Iphiclides podalirius]
MCVGISAAGTPPPPGRTCGCCSGRGGGYALGSSWGGPGLEGNSGRMGLASEAAPQGLRGEVPLHGDGHSQPLRCAPLPDRTDAVSSWGGVGASTSFCNDPTRSAEAPPATTPGRRGAGEGGERGGWTKGGGGGTVTQSPSTVSPYESRLTIPLRFTVMNFLIYRRK